MPRFELASLPEAIHNRAWMFLGSGVARSGIKNKLRESIGALLKQELHAYGRALTQWSNQFVTKTVLLIGSYADAYRVQLHRIAGIHGEAVDAPRMADDLSLLKNWNPARNRDEGEAIEREA
jgi:hypothetical protein